MVAVYVKHHRWLNICPGPVGNMADQPGGARRELEAPP